MKNPLGKKNKITVSPNTGPKGGNLKEAINLQVFRQVISKRLSSGLLQVNRTACQK